MLVVSLVGSIDRGRGGGWFNWKGSFRISLFRYPLLEMSAWCSLNSTQRLSPANLVASYGHSLGSFQDCVTSRLRDKLKERLRRIPPTYHNWTFSKKTNLLFLFNLIVPSNNFLINTTLKTFIEYLQVFYLLSLRPWASIILKSLGNYRYENTIS